MKYSGIIVLLLFIGVAPFCASAEVMDRVIATVKDEPVTLLEVRSILSSKQGYDPDKVLTEMDIREAVLVILFRREASKLGVSITEEEINEYIRRVEIANGGDEGSVREELQKQGMSWDKYRDKIKEELGRSRVLAINLRPQVQVTDEEVAKYLGGKEKSVSKDGTFLVQIKFNLNSEEKQQAEDMEHWVRYLKDNHRCFSTEEFRAECIFMGQVEVDDLKEEVKDIVQDLEEFERSEIEKEEGSDTGVVFVRVRSDFGDESGETFSKIKEQLYQKRFMEKAGQFVSHDIFEQYGVEIYQ